MTMKRTEAKLRLERFIASPSTKTLQSFVECVEDYYYCLYAACVNNLHLANEITLMEQECPEQCDKLSEERFSVFDDFLCASCAGEVDYLDAWENHPAELVLHLIRFNAYIESMLAEKGDGHETNGS
jgi:hypothetical protein